MIFASIRALLVSAARSQSVLGEQSILNPTIACDSHIYRDSLYGTLENQRIYEEIGYAGTRNHFGPIWDRNYEISKVFTLQHSVGEGDPREDFELVQSPSCPIWA